MDTLRVGGVYIWCVIIESGALRLHITYYYVT